MKKFILLIFLFFSFFGFSQTVLVDDTTYSLDQLINDVLIQGSCSEAQNINSPNNANLAGEGFNSFGYFQRGTSNFPFEEGIVLHSGDVNDIPLGPVSAGSNPPWMGDGDLDLTSGGNTNNATSVIFEFTPVVDHISFNYLLASEEYETGFQYPCTFADVFAFILRGPGIPNVNPYNHDGDPGTPDINIDLGGRNIAVLPGTNIPATITNIHDEGPCNAGSLGSVAYPEYYDSVGSGMGDTGFNGRTVVLTAEADVVPGQTYTIELVVADFQDSILDTAVFLEAGSFVIGNVDLGVDLTVATGNARCLGETYTIAPSLTVPPGTTYEWTYEDPVGSGTFVPFTPPETGSTLDVTATGTYQLTVDFAGVCTSSGMVYIEFDIPPVVNTMPDALVLCDIDNDGFGTFTLSDADIDITGGDPNQSVTYHPTLSDAQNDLNVLPNLYNNDDPYNDVVFARVVDANSSCQAFVTVNLEVRDTPMVVPPGGPLRLCDYNNPGDGLEVFDLTVVETEVLNGLDPTMYDIYYYENQAQAVLAGDLALTAPDFSQAIGTPTMYQNITPNMQVVYILVVGNGTSTTPNTTASGCYAIEELTLLVDPLPVAVQPAPYELCDDELNGSTRTDQISTFDLTTQEAFITGGDPSLSVTWYETPGDELADNPILTPSAYQNRAIPPAPINPQTIVARVTSAFDCKVTVTLTLVVNPNPSPVAPSALEVCDDNNDGFSEFTLTDKDAEIIGGEPGVVVSYFETLTLAELGDPLTALTSPYNNIVAYLQTIYARVDNPTTGCYSIVSLDLVVNSIPAAPVVPGFGDLTACDGTGGGSAIFNLEQNTPFVYGSQDPMLFTISYHTDLIEAQTDVNPIGNTLAFASTGQTIWVRLEDNMTGCFRVSSFELIVGMFPTIANPSDMELCDDPTGGSTTDGISSFDLTLNDAAITLGDTGLSVFYYETAAAQASGTFINPATSYANTLGNPQTLFVSVFNAAGCEARTTLTLIVNPNPTPVSPTPLEVCDDDNDGFASFTLTDKDAEIIGGEPGASVSYHETLMDAQNGVFALTSPYSNIFAFSQIVYARVFFAGAPAGTGCWTVVELELIVNESPEVPLSLPDLTQCDDDGFTLFDLTQQDALVYGTQDPALYALSYHVSLSDAQGDLNPIGNPTAYMNVMTPQQSIWVRLEELATGCFTTREFLLVVSLGPSITQPTALEQCDDLGEPNDGITVFDLTQKDDEITGGALGVEVFYYETQQDANDDTNRISPASSYTNLVNLQTLYVRVVDGNTSCFDSTSVTLLLRVLPNPTPGEPDALELCDVNDPGDGIEVFDLTQAAAQIQNGGSWDLDYYESYALALAGDVTTAIVDPTMYSNVVAGSDVVYVRVSFDRTDLAACFEIVELVLIVHDLPDASVDISPYKVCEVGNDGRAIFDLTTKIEEILNGQDPLVHTVTFYEVPTDAQAGINPIVNTTGYENDGTPSPPGQELYVGILNTQTGCYIASALDPVSGEYSLSFNLQVLEGAVATSPLEPYTICDNTDPNDGFAIFDLTDPVLTSQILGGQSTPPYSLTFYESLEQAELGDVTTVLGGSYTNIINPQVIYARVTNLDTECYEVAQVILKVEQLPTVTLDEEYRLCVDENGNPIPEEEGSVSPPTIDTGLDPGLYTFVWAVDGQILPGEFGASIVALQGGNYVVTVTEIATGCSMDLTTTVTVSQPPLTYEAILVNGAFADTHVVEVLATGLGSYVYQLDDGSFQDSNIFENVTAGSHTITIKDANGCGSVSFEFGVIDYPKYFTPNEDGIHDRWNIIGIADFDPTAKIYIFDRFGKLLKQVSPLGNGWDGTYNGNPLPSSDYWFRVEYTEQEAQQIFNGHFTLKR